MTTLNANTTIPSESQWLRLKDQFAHADVILVGAHGGYAAFCEDAILLAAAVLAAGLPPLVLRMGPRGVLTTLVELGRLDEICDAAEAEGYAVGIIDRLILWPKENQGLLID